MSGHQLEGSHRKKMSMSVIQIAVHVQEVVPWAQNACLRRFQAKKRIRNIAEISVNMIPFHLLLRNRF